jgi:hypothetical protein
VKVGTLLADDSSAHLAVTNRFPAMRSIGIVGEAPRAARPNGSIHPFRIAALAAPGLAAMRNVAGCLKKHTHPGCDWG